MPEKKSDPCFGLGLSLLAPYARSFTSHCLGFLIYQMELLVFVL